MHHSVRFDLWQQRELRIDDCDAGEVDVVAALLGEDLREPRNPSTATTAFQLHH
jgi:hypothetical protein